VVTVVRHTCRLVHGIDARMVESSCHQSRLLAVRIKVLKVTVSLPGPIYGTQPRARFFSETFCAATRAARVLGDLRTFRLLGCALFP
jgi:hypothetical protein